MKDFISGIAIGLGVSLLSWGFSHVHAQKAEKGTQHWILNGTGGYYPGRVDIFDTNGICIYLYSSSSERAGNMVAIPKTQLPTGTGCQ
jgi:hypothetical protein